MFQSFAYFTTLLRKDFTEYCTRRLAEVGVSMGTLYFILYVSKHPDCSPKELAQALHMDAGHTARSLNKLEQDGFLTQTVNPNDRRAHLLRLTDKGEKVFDLSHDLFYQWDEVVLQPLSPQEREQLTSLLKKLVCLDGEIPCIRHDSSPAEQ